jgi:hypothetical protein
LNRFAALIIASAVAITAQAQTTSELSISGTVEKLGGNLVTLSLSQGISIVVRLEGQHSGQERSKRRPHRNSDRLVRSGVEQT